MFWFLFWIALLGASAVFIDPCIVAGIVSVYIVITVGWFIASVLIFVATIFTICFFIACAFRGHPEWLVWCGHFWTTRVCVWWPWLPPWVDLCCDRLDKCTKHHWVDPYWTRILNVRDVCLIWLDWDSTCDRTCSYVYNLFMFPWPKQQQQQEQGKHKKKLS